MASIAALNRGLDSNSARSYSARLCRTAVGGAWVTNWRAAFSRSGRCFLKSFSFRDAHHVQILANLLADLAAAIQIDASQLPAEVVADVIGQLLPLLVLQSADSIQSLDQALERIGHVGDGGDEGGDLPRAERLEEFSWRDGERRESTRCHRRDRFHRRPSRYPAAR